MLNIWPDTGDSVKAYSEPSRTSEMELFAKIFDHWKLSTVTKS